MKLLCSNLDCEFVCQEFEAAGTYLNPECGRCWSPMRPFDAPHVEFYSVDPSADFMAALPVEQPADELVPAIRMTLRQAS